MVAFVFFINFWHLLTVFPRESFQMGGIVVKATMILTFSTNLVVHPGNPDDWFLDTYRVQILIKIGFGVLG
jgi:hypothetical protein